MGITIGKPNKFFILYLGILSLAGGGIIYLAASRVGPGVSNDAAMMLSVAENVTKGAGFFDFRGDVLTQFPPVYPLLLASGNLLFGQDVVVIGWIINILVFGAIIWFSGFLLYETFYDEPVLAYIGTFVVFSSTSLIKISSNIASDPLFMLIVIFFLMSLSTYLSTGRIRLLFLTGFLIVIGCFERYAGLSLVPVAGLVLIYKFRNNIGYAIRLTFLFIVLTATPIFLWGYLHNYQINRTVFGERIPYMPVVNFISGSEKLLNWFIPTQVISHVGPLFLYMGILILLALAVFWAGAASFVSIINSSRVIPHVALLIVYAGVLTFNITPELQGLETDRAHIILLPSLLMILLSVGSLVIKTAKDKWGKIPVYLITTLLFLMWSVYPLSKSFSYIERSMVNGDVSSYNSLNKVNIKYTAFSKYLSTLDVHDRQFYSNGEAALWFILHVQVHSLPKSESSHRPTLTYLRENYNGWPGGEGYLVWFNSYASKEYLATPDELNSISIMKEVYSDENGSVYSIKPQ